VKGAGARSQVNLISEDGAGVERSFADAKQLHGHRYARMRGLAKVQQQCLLAATAQNIKKIALLLSRIGPQMPSSTLHTLLSAYSAQLRKYQQLADLPNPTH
jgi:hypothetical protein